MGYPNQIGLNDHINFATNHELLKNLLKKSSISGRFLELALAPPKTGLVRFVEALVPVHSCRPQDLERYLGMGAVLSKSERGFEDQTRNGLTDFIRASTASVTSSWKIDDPGNDLFVDYIESYCTRQTVTKTEASGKREEALLHNLTVLHNHVFYDAPDRTADKQYARIQTAASTVLKKVKKEGLPMFYSENYWNRPAVAPLQRDRVVWSVLGPNTRHGSIAIIMNPGIMKHPDVYW
jgi:hypothetical protein